MMNGEGIVEPSYQASLATLGKAGSETIYRMT